MRIACRACPSNVAPRNRGPSATVPVDSYQTLVGLRFAPGEKLQILIFISIGHEYATEVGCKDHTAAAVLFDVPLRVGVSWYCNKLYLATFTVVKNIIAGLDFLA